LIGCFNPRPRILEAGISSHHGHRPAAKFKLQRHLMDNELPGKLPSTSSTTPILSIGILLPVHSKHTSLSIPIPFPPTILNSPSHPHGPQAQASHATLSSNLTLMTPWVLYQAIKVLIPEERKQASTLSSLDETRSPSRPVHPKKPSLGRSAARLLPFHLITSFMQFVTSVSDALHQPRPKYK
jgi:hypothetical protein